MATATAPDSAPPGTHRSPRANLGAGERIVSTALGAVLGIAATQSKGPLGIIFGIAGGAMLARGVGGAAPIKRMLGQEPDEAALAKKQGWSSAAKVARAVTINADRDQVWAVIREVERWPSFMVNIKSATSDGNRLTFTSAEATGAIQTVATITEDIPRQKFSWESDRGSKVPNRGHIVLRDAPGARGTEVHALIAYEPPLGSIGRYAAKLTQREPGVQTRRDLKRLKSLIEAGEVATNARTRAEAVENALKA